MKPSPASVVIDGQAVFCPAATSLVRVFGAASRRKLLLPVVALLWTMFTSAEAQFAYTAASGTITLTNYAGPGGAVIIPSTLNGLPVTRIADNAFYNWTNLTSVSIPNSVTNIGGLAFNGCASLTAITVDTNNPVYSSLDGVLFNKSQTTLSRFPSGRTGSYAIPNSVTLIGDLAFTTSSGLTNVTISNSMTRIGNGAFQGCSGLTTVTIPASVTQLGAFSFGGCPNLTTVYFLGNAPCCLSDTAFRCSDQSQVGQKICGDCVGHTM